METKFNFKSQIATSKEQSERLLALGLKKETADMCYKVTTHDFKGNEINEKDRHYTLCCWYDESSLVCGLERKETIPAWSLGRLIEMLPSKIQPKEELPSYSGCAYLNLFQSAVWYSYTDYDIDERTLISWSGNGFFSAVVEAIEWLIKEGYFNKEYLEK